MLEFRMYKYFRSEVFKILPLIGLDVGLLPINPIDTKLIYLSHRSYRISHVFTSSTLF
jgi:hypothetical protein